MTGRGDTPERLAQKLDHRFARPELLDEALCHSSLAMTQPEETASNERLEFLGDRVLGVVVARLLFDRFVHEDEGALARRHAELVRKETLARVADLLDLGGHLRLARSEEETGGRTNPAILADACEAVIAAMFLDGGLEVAARFIERHWVPLMEEDLTPPKDAKTALQEWAQGRGMPLPDYREVGRDGPPHAPTFRIEVTLPGEEPGSAEGGSKRAAEQAAAQALLERLEARYGE